MVRINSVVNQIIDFANGFYYTACDGLLFNGEIQAWQYGPVAPEIYYEFKRFGREAVNDTYSCVYDPAEMDDIFIHKTGISSRKTWV